MGIITKRFAIILAGIIFGIIVSEPLRKVIPYSLGLYAQVVVVIIFTIIFGVIGYFKTKNEGNSPIFIIEEKYAKGEITREEFDKMKDDLD